MHSYRSLRMTGAQHGSIRRHLFPGDGNEAVAFALCGTLHEHAMSVHELHPVPYGDCIVRAADRVTWRTDVLPAILAEAESRNLSLLKIHSHPEDFRRFSGTDDLADAELSESVAAWLGPDRAYASAVMLPDGRIFARTADPTGAFSPIESVSVAGDDILLWKYSAIVTSAGTASASHPEFARRTVQAFGRGTTAMLGELSVAVIGCSGTGSPLVEMLARLGVRRLVLIDPDHVEEKNLNRINNATMADARDEVAKVEVMARAIRAMGLGTVVEPIAASLSSPGVVRRVATCDLVLGCMDSVDGRDLLNRLATFYCLPYIDVGVRLVADGTGGVDQICGTVHYLEPGGSSLLSRGVYTASDIQAAALRRENPERYAALLREKYIAGVREERPAVISVNMFYASLAVNELLARLHPYRDDGNAEFASYGISLTQARIIAAREDEPCLVLSRHVGRGDVRPLLNMPELSEGSEA
jgi:ThiF family/Prokaryotic homologs of the JAB domain